MADDERFNQIREEIRQRAAAFEDNTVVPDEPTLTGWLVVMVDEIAGLRLRVENLEARGEGPCGAA